MGTDALFCVVADGAGVDDDNVGVFDRVGEYVAVVCERDFDEGRVELVHLTPVGLEAHFHSVPPNLGTGVPALRFALANLRGHPKDLCETVIVFNLLGIV